MNGTVELDAFNDKIDLKIPENATVTYARSVVKDAIRYKVSGTMLLERKINTQIPNEDQAVEW